MLKLQDVLSRFKEKETAARCVLNCTLAQSRIVDLVDQRTVERLHPELKYGHGIELIRNLSLWPVDIYVRTMIGDSSQVSYEGTKQPCEWEFITSLAANQGSGEKITLLSCINKISGRETLTTTFLNQNGDTDVLELHVIIE